MTRLDDTRRVTSRARLRVQRTSAILAALLGLWALWLFAAGGLSLRMAGIVVRSHDPLRPLIAALLSAAVFFFAGGRATLIQWIEIARPHATTAWHMTMRVWRAGYAHHAIAAAAVLAVLIVGIVRGSTAVGGADSFGYVSEAELFLKGRVAISQPWVREVPWPAALWTFTPLGYTPSRPVRFSFGGYTPVQEPWAIVPTYSPGLPLLMALGKTIGGLCGPFLVVPIAGALLILSTYLIGLRLGSRSLGLLATLLMMTSPAFLLMQFVNMSDVPVAGTLIFGCWCLLGKTMRSAAGAALGLAVALLIRPNLVPLVPVFVLWLAWRIVRERESRARHVWRAVIVLGGIGAASVATAVIYWVTYGTPFESGYGETAYYFALSHIGPNVRNYVQWFNESHTPLGFLGLIALALPVKSVWPDLPERSPIVLFALITAAVIGEFLIYLVMDNSSYLRFFLVCYPFIMIGLASTAMALARVHPRAGPVLATALLAIVIGNGIRISAEWRVFDQGLFEAKYADVAAHVRSATPENSVVLAMQHSGSLRYFAGRVTLRWDILKDDRLDQAVDWLAGRGVHTYALFDTYEQTEAVKRFAGQRLAAVLDGPPVFRFGNKVFYDLGLPPGTAVRTIDLPVIDVTPQCHVPFDPPALVWKR